MEHHLASTQVTKGNGFPLVSKSQGNGGERMVWEDLNGG
jgi:hypothetical protein